MIDSPYGLLVQMIARTEEETILKLESGEVLHWPNANFPSAVTVGEKVRLVVETEALYHQERTALTKAVLNELLQGSH